MLELATPYLIEAIDPARCLELLSSARLGRMVASVDCLPIAVPVRVEVVDGHVLFGSPFDAVRAAAVRGDVVSVEIEGQVFGRSTWSVHATGVAVVARSDGALAARSASTELARMVAHGGTLVAVPLTHLRGQRAWLSRSDAREGHGARSRA